MALSPLPRYLSDGGCVFYWHGLAEPEVNKSEITLPEVEFERVLFFGSRYGYREELIDYLVKYNVPVDVYGNGWGSGFISYDELAYKIPRYVVNLGVSAIGYTSRLSCVKGRGIEVPSLGGLNLHNENREIKFVFEENKEIIQYNNKKSCFRMINKILDSPGKFKAVKLGGLLKSSLFGRRARFAYFSHLMRGMGTFWFFI